MRFEVSILGSNGAVPLAGRHSSAHFLSSEATDVLIDCGEGTQMRLQAAGHGLGRVEVILITHLHGDHFFGLPGLITSLALTGRTAPLRIVSPPGLREKIAPLLELDRWQLPFPLTFVPHAARAYGLLTTTGDLEIFSFPLRHRISTNGYLVRERAREPNILKEQVRALAIPWQEIADIKAGADYTTPDGRRVPNAELLAPASPPRSYAYCSDTVYFPELASYVRGVDLLYHEATFLHDMAEEAREKGHSTAHEAAVTARAAGAGTLILGHFSSRYPQVNDHEAEARAIFPQSYAARDLYRYGVPHVGRDAQK
ncbi:ribonuclease Z [Lewinella aquimaris]|uniref:Ribonuclease Z n=1 Tax=Neolewinella aquimaris TaxID=1835722 RepID=A0A840E714_9BACT|nr:ribonuclease Z [Neolewinella aquimaris]MBB4077589.1 ribonuclease Z [Neolewinella aquimaris]